MQRLAFQTEDTGDDFVSDQVFIILEQTLQPDSELSSDAAVEQIVALLPEGNPYSHEVDGFLTTCYQLAEQIPYSHPSMIKLITIIDSCLNSPKLENGRTTAVCMTRAALISRTMLKTLQEISAFRYQKLKETIYDWWNSTTPAGSGAARYINFNTFVAQIDERGMCKGPELAIGVLRDTFEDQKKGRTSEDRDAYVQAASQWLLLQGDVVYSQVADGKLAKSRWQRWQEGLSAVVARKSEKGACEYSQDTVEMVSRALVAMESLARKETE